MADHEHVGPTDEGFKARRAEPGQRFGYTTVEGEQREIVADPGGLIVPRDAAEEAVLDGFDLPFGRITANDRERGSATVRKLTGDGGDAEAPKEG